MRRIIALGALVLGNVGMLATKSYADPDDGIVIDCCKENTSGLQFCCDDCCLGFTNQCSSDSSCNC